MSVHHLEKGEYSYTTYKHIQINSTALYNVVQLCFKIGDSFEFEMSGSMGNGAHYVALAFAEKNIMQNADTYICNGQSLRSAVITRRYREPTSLRLEVTLSNRIQFSEIEGELFTFLFYFEGRNSNCSCKHY